MTTAIWNNVDESHKRAIDQKELDTHTKKHLNEIPKLC